MDPTTKDIMRSLDRITTHRRRSKVFDDWLELVDAYLRMLPAHAESIATNGRPADDDDEAKELWKRLLERERYDADDMKHFAQACTALLVGSHAGNGAPDYKDVLGYLYMEWSHPNSHTGQYFTPFEICRMMANVTTHDLMDQLRERIVAAIGVDWSELGFDPMKPHTLEWIATKHLPARIERFDPITVQDPCVGSGGMLLAVAAALPAWVVRTGLVRFYGQDIDHSCVLMARINMKLYGLNGYGLRVSMAGAALAAAGGRG